MWTALNDLPTASRDFNEALVWLPGPNPYGLSVPPRWFLQELWTFDPRLVMFASQEEPLYRLCRRVEHGQPILTALVGNRKNGKERPDTAVLVTHRLVPITSVLPSPMVAWSTTLLHDLARRDIRRAGGWRKAADRLDEFDDQEEQAWRRNLETGAADLARFAYRAAKWRNGETVDLGGRKLHGARTGARPNAFHPVIRPRLAGDRPSCAIFTGRDDPLQEVRPRLVEDGDPETPDRHTGLFHPVA